MATWNFYTQLKTQRYTEACAFFLFSCVTQEVLESDVCYPQVSLMQGLTLSLPMTYSGIYMLFYLGSYRINVLSPDIAMLVACRPMAYAVDSF